MLIKFLSPRETMQRYRLDLEPPTLIYDTIQFSYFGWNENDGPLCYLAFKKIVSQPAHTDPCYFQKLEREAFRNTELDWLRKLTRR